MALGSTLGASVGVVNGPGEPGTAPRLHAIGSGISQPFSIPESWLFVGAIETTGAGVEESDVDGVGIGVAVLTGLEVVLQSMIVGATGGVVVMDEMTGCSGLTDLGPDAEEETAP